MARPDCTICGGSGWKIVERTAQGAQAIASAETSRAQAAHAGATGAVLHQSVGAADSKTVWAVPCDCTASDRTDRALARARVPERYRHCDFANFESDNEFDGVSREQQQAWNRCLSQAKIIVERFSAEFPVSNEQGLLIMGPCGVGKTHLAVAALKQVVLRGHSGLFYDYRELLKQIQDSYNAESQSTEMAVLEPVLKTEILVLDDVGSSKPSIWALETVGHILNTRYNDKLATILTTNFPDSDSGSRSSPDSTPHRLIGTRGPAVEDSLTDRVGTRIRSRLYEMCRTVEVSAPDYRREIRNVSRYRQ